MDLQEIGALLKRRREEMGLTLRDAQTATKIRQRYLEALERGDDSVMPGYVYTKGFLKAYAAYLDLDPFQLVAHYKTWKEGGTQDPSGRGRARRRAGQAADSNPRTRRANGRGGDPQIRLPRALPGPTRVGGGRGMGSLLLAILLVAASVLGAVYLYQAARDGLPALMENFRRDQAEPPPDTGDPEEDPGGGADSDEHDEGDTEPDPGPESDPEPPPVQVTDSGTGPVIYEVSSGPIAVEFRATSPCWLEVASGGRILFEGTLQSGQSRTFEFDGTAETRVRAGYPPGLRVTVNGQDAGTPSGQNPRNLIFRVAEAGEN